MFSYIDSASQKLLPCAIFAVSLLYEICVGIRKKAKYYAAQLVLALVRGSSMVNTDRLARIAGEFKIGASLGFSKSLFFQKRIKRAFDIFASCILMLLALPFMAAIALVIRLDGGQAIFCHTRIGLGGMPFSCFKFRSMILEADAVLARHISEDPKFAEQWVLHRKAISDPRVTRIGRIIRATSLDELPQLLNVLRGDMSLVGPRPVVSEELDRYYDSAGRAAYVSVRPGITGLWQVSGRSRTTYAERVSLDVRYVNELSLAGDIKLLLRTVPAVLLQRGAF